MLRQAMPQWTWMGRMQWLSTGSLRPTGDIRGIELTAPERLFVYRPRPPKVQLAGD